MEGPSQAKIECDDKGDGSCDVRYWPQEAGEYAVHVLCNSEDIRLSPFMADIREAPQDFHPDRVKGIQHSPEPWLSAFALSQLVSKAEPLAPCSCYSVTYFPT